MTQAERAHRSLTHKGESMRQHRLDGGLALGELFLPHARLLLELLGGQALGPALQRIDLLHQGRQPLHHAVIAGAEDTLQGRANRFAELAQLVRE